MGGVQTLMVGQVLTAATCTINSLVHLCTYTHQVARTDSQPRINSHRCTVERKVHVESKYLVS